MSLLDEARDPLTFGDQLRVLARDPALVATVADNPSAPPDLLAELASHQDAAVRAAVAGNPNAPWSAIAQVGAEFPDRFFDNPVLPLLLMEHADLFHTLPVDAACKLMRYATFPAPYLAQFKTYPDIAVQHSAQLVCLLQAPCAPEEWQTRARQALQLDDFNSDVRRGIRDQWVFRLPGTIQPWLLEMVAGSVWRGARAVVAHCPDAPPALHETLALDEDRNVRRALAENAHLTPALLATLAGDSEKEVRVAVAKNPAATPQILGKLARDGSSEVRATVALHPNTPLIMLAELMSMGEDNINDLVACNTGLNEATFARVLELSALAPTLVEARDPQTPQERLYELAQSSLKDVLIAVAENPATPRDVVQKLSEYDSERVRAAIARLERPLLDDGASSSIAALVKKHGYPFLAACRQTPPNVLQWLSQNKHRRIRALVAQNLSLPPAVLAQLARDPATAVRQRVAERPDLTPEIFEQLAGDHDTWVRQSLIKHSPLRPTVEQLRDFITRGTSYQHFVASYPGTPGEILSALFQLTDYADIDMLLLTHPNATDDLRRQTRQRLLCRGARHYRTLARVVALTCADLPGEFLAQFAESTDWATRLVVARHPNTPPEVVAMLERDSLPVVRAAARARLLA